MSMFTVFYNFATFKIERLFVMLRFFTSFSVIWNLVLLTSSSVTRVIETEKKEKNIKFSTWKVPIEKESPWEINLQYLILAACCHVQIIMGFKI